MPLTCPNLLAPLQIIHKDKGKGSVSWHQWKIFFKHYVPSHNMVLLVSSWANPVDFSNRSSNQMKLLLLNRLGKHEHQIMLKSLIPTAASHSWQAIWRFCSSKNSRQPHAACGMQYEYTIMYIMNCMLSVSKEKTSTSLRLSAILSNHMYEFTGLKGLTWFQKFTWVEKGRASISSLILKSKMKWLSETKNCNILQFSARVLFDHCLKYHDQIRNSWAN